MGILLVLLFLSFFLLAGFLIQRPYVQKFLIKKFADATGYNIRTKKIDLNLWQGIGIYAHGLEASSRRGSESITASRVRIILDVGQLFKRRIIPVKIFLHEPRIELAIENIERSSRPWESLLQKALPAFFLFPGLQSISTEKGQIHLKNRPFALKDLYFDVRKKDPGHGALVLSARGKVEFRKEKVPFSLRGTISHGMEKRIFSHTDLDLKTGKIPMSWISWPDSMPVKQGDFEAHVKIMGNLGGCVSVNGKILMHSLRFSLLKPGRKKDYSISGIALDFKSVIQGREISIPSMKLSTTDILMDISLKLDLKDKRNPYLELKAKSPYMTLETFKYLFPTTLLSPWVENRLFPLLNRGDVRLKLLSLKGRLDELKNLRLPRNHRVFTMKVECKNFEVLGNGIKHPFRDVAAKVIFQNGALLVSGLRANFKDSTIREAGLEVRDIFSHKPSVEVLMDGSFDLHALLDQKDMDFIPPDVIRKLNQMESISGNLECRARFRYEYGWEFPRTRSGEFTLRDCLIKQRDLYFPLSLKSAEIHIDEKNENRFIGTGSWGKSIFKATGVFGHAEEVFPLQWANIFISIDMNEVLPFFYLENQLPLTFSRPVRSRLSLTRERDHWSCAGKVDLEGIMLENDYLSMDPPGSEDNIVFDLDLRPGELVDVKKIQCNLKDSSLEFSGFYNLTDKDIFTVEISVPALSFEDLGIRFKKGVTHSQGTVKGHLKITASRLDPLATIVVGRMEGENLSFTLNRFPSPISECQFKLAFSGKEVAIDTWKMRVGKSLMDISGELSGWNGLKGEVTVISPFLNTEDIFSPGKASPLSDDNTYRNKFMDNLDIRLKLDLLKGRWEKLEWGPLTADLDFRKGDIYINKSRVCIDNGVFKVNGHVTRREKQEMLFYSHVRLADEPIEDMLVSLGVEDEYLSGSLTTEAFLFMKGKEKKDLIPSLRGTANILIKKGIIKKSNIFIKVLNFLSLQKIFKKRPSELSGEGFYFENLGGHVEINKGVLGSNDFMMKSPVFNAVASGKVDMAKKTVDFHLGARPLGTIDVLLSRIPILGYILVGKEKSFLTYYFNMKGPLTDPVLKHVPFKNIGKGIAGILKRLLLTPVWLFEQISDTLKGFSEADSPLSETGL